MKHIIKALVLSVLVACGGEAQGPDASDAGARYCSPEAPNDPGQLGRLDGSVCEDGIFNSAEAKQTYCATHSEDWFCSELGNSEQAWRSGEYHGYDTTSHTPCYGPASVGGSCVFPRLKQYRVKINTTGCFVGAAPPQGPSTLQEQNMLDALKSAAKAWNGVGGLTVVDDGSPGSSGYTLLTVTCGPCTSDAPTCVATGGVAGTQTTKITNLPVGPHGKDQGAAKQWSSSAQSFLSLNTANMWADIVSKCSSGGITAGEIIGRATAAGMHEFGHVVSFGHFDSGSLSTNIMYPFVSPTCASTVSIQQVFGAALSAYDPDMAGTTVLDVHLQDKTPE